MNKWAGHGPDWRKDVYPKTAWKDYFRLCVGILALLLAIPTGTNAGSPIDGSLPITEAAEQEVMPQIA